MRSFSSWSLAKLSEGKSSASHRHSVYTDPFGTRLPPSFLPSYFPQRCFSRDFEDRRPLIEAKLGCVSHLRYRDVLTWLEQNRGELMKSALSPGRVVVAQHFT
jgi:hypothetical protein